MTIRFNSMYNSWHLAAVSLNLVLLLFDFWEAVRRSIGYVVTFSRSDSRIVLLKSKEWLHNLLLLIPPAAFISWDCSSLKYFWYCQAIRTLSDCNKVSSVVALVITTYLTGLLYVFQICAWRRLALRGIFICFARLGSLRRQRRDIRQGLNDVFRRFIRWGQSDI